MMCIRSVWWDRMEAREVYAADLKRLWNTNINHNSEKQFFPFILIHKSYGGDAFLISWWWGVFNYVAMMRF